MSLDLPGYRPTGQIGVGARSIITQVVRNTTGEFFALKRVVRRAAEDDKFIQQAEFEFEVSSQLDHPALRKSFEIHRRKRWFKTRELLILMEYVDGLTLESDRPLDLSRTIDIFKKIAHALDAMHERGFIHADIKPNNILLTGNGDVKIIDFGQSCPVGHKKDRIQGTPDYIAPEQVRRLPLDRRTDVYNLGATLYWVLTERTYPTDLRHSTKPGAHEIVGSVRSPKELNADVPAALSTLVMDCCASNPDGRPKNMKQFMARLDVAERKWATRNGKNDGSNDTPTPRIDAVGG